MHPQNWKQIFILAFSLVFFCCGRVYAQSPTITGISPASGPVGLPVTITGTGFGATQGASTVSLGSMNAVVTSWSDTSVVAIVPSGASSGAFTVTVSGQGASSPTFTITALPSGWSDGDIGAVGLSGSANFANGAFTINGAGASFVSATRTPSCKDLRRNAMLRHDQALKEGLDEVAKAGLRAGT